MQKAVIWAIVVLIIAGGVLMENRYTVKIHSPIVAKIDNITGDVWIANSGVWMKVQNQQAQPAVPGTPAAKTN